MATWHRPGFLDGLIVEMGVGRWHRQVPMVAVHQARAVAHRRRAAAALGAASTVAY